MVPEGVQTTPTGVGTFESFFDFKVNLRQLGIYLMEMHRPAKRKRPWRFTDPGPASRNEKALLIKLAMEHLDRHWINAGRHGVGARPRPPLVEHWAALRS